MERATLVGLGFAAVSCLLPYAVKEIPRWLSYSGIAVGIFLILVGLCVGMLPAIWVPKISHLALYCAGVGLIACAATLQFAGEKTIKQREETQPPQSQLSEKVVPTIPPVDVDKPTIEAVPQSIFIGGDFVKDQAPGFFQLVIVYQGTLTAEPDIKIVGVSAELKSEAATYTFPARYNKKGNCEDGWTHEAFEPVTASQNGVAVFWDLLQFEKGGRVALGAVKEGSYILTLRLLDEKGQTHEASMPRPIELTAEHVANIKQHEGVYAYWDGAKFGYSTSEHTQCKH